MPRQYSRLEPEERFVCVQSQVRTGAIRKHAVVRDDADSNVFARSVVFLSAGERVFIGQRLSLRNGGIRAAANDGGWQKSKS
jgi:hypothetical protein